MTNKRPSLAKNVLFPHSLRYQLLARTLFILAFILLAIGLLQYFVMKDFLYQNEADTLGSKLMSLPKNIGINRDFGPAFPMMDGRNDGQISPDQNKVFFLQDFSLAQIDENGNFTDLMGNSSLQAPKLSKKEYESLEKKFTSSQNVNYQIVRNSNGIEQLIVFRPNHGNHDANLDYSPGLLQIGINTEPLHKLLMQQLTIFIVLSLLALTAGLIIYLRVLKKTLIPLSNMVNAVKNTNAGNLADRIPVQQGQEEIDRLADSFNGMLERLEASFDYERETKEQMQRFIADASHELRTPLTSINGFLEVLLRGAAARPEQLNKALNSMHGESRRIIKLVEDLLLLTKLDRKPVLQLSDTNLTALIREMEPQLSVLAANRKIRYDLSEEVFGSYESDKIKQVILNLFNNAVQHTDPDAGNIALSLKVSGHNAELSIQDNGSGIAPDSLQHIFDRFYRADTSRTRQYGGSGLGLAITKSIVEAHKGHITAESKEGKGTLFRVCLPIKH